MPQLHAAYRKLACRLLLLNSHRVPLSAPAVHVIIMLLCIACLPSAYKPDLFSLKYPTVVFKENAQVYLVSEAVQAALFSIPARLLPVLQIPVPHCRFIWAPSVFWHTDNLFTGAVQFTWLESRASTRFSAIVWYREDESPDASFFANKQVMIPAMVVYGRQFQFSVAVHILSSANPLFTLCPCHIYLYMYYPKPL